MKIAFIVTSLNPGGAETMLVRLAGEIMRRGHAVVILAILPVSAESPLRRECQRRAIPVWELGTAGNPIRTLGRWLYRLWLTWQFGPDVIQGWMYHGNFVSTLLAALLGGRGQDYWSIHHAGVSRVELTRATWSLVRFSGALSHLSERVVFNCAARSIESHVSKMGYRRSTQCLLPNGFDLRDLYRDESERRKFRDKHGLNDGAVAVGLVARFHPHKDHNNFIRAAALAGQECSALVFVLCGSGISERNAELAAWLAESGLRNRVILLEHQTSIRTLLNGLDLLCVSSATEAFPLVLGEAMACGVPCVTTRVGDAPELVGDLGIVVEPGNPAQLAAGLLAMRGRIGREDDGFGSRLAQRIATNYGLDAMVERVLGTYGARRGIAI